MDQAEASGKTVDDALNAALRKLGATREEVEFTVLDEGKRGMLFVKGRDAMVRVVRTQPARPSAGAAGTESAEGESRGRSRRGRRGGGGGRNEGAATGERGPENAGQRRERSGTGRERGGRGGGAQRGGRKSFEEAVPKLTEADFAVSRDDAAEPGAGGGRDDRRGQSGGGGRSRGGRRERGGRSESRGDRGPRRPEAVVEPNIDAPEVDLAATVVDDLLRMFDIDADITLREPLTPGDGLGSALAVIDIGGEDLGVLIGRRGDTLLNLQYLVNLILNRRYPGDASVTIDVEHYRHRREEQLTELALRMGERVKEHGNPITLEPMPASERRLVHLALAENDDLETNSIGEGDDRKVVISPRGYR